MSIIDVSFLNTSDHLPVTATIQLPGNNEPSMHGDKENYHSDYIPSFVWKNEKFIEQYHTTILDVLSDFVPSDNLSKRVSEIHSLLKDSAIRAHNALTNNKNFHFFNSKPWWNTNLTKKKKTLQHFFNIWKSDGFTLEILFC